MTPTKPAVHFVQNHRHWKEITIPRLNVFKRGFSSRFQAHGLMLGNWRAILGSIALISTVSFSRLSVNFSSSIWSFILSPVDIYQRDTMLPVKTDLVLRKKTVTYVFTTSMNYRFNQKIKSRYRKNCNTVQDQSRALNLCYCFW